jgi:hypothetical protein
MADRFSLTTRIILFRSGWKRDHGTVIPENSHEVDIAVPWLGMFVVLTDLRD